MVEEQDKNDFQKWLSRNWIHMFTQAGNSTLKLRVAIDRIVLRNLYIMYSFTISNIFLGRVLTHQW